MVRRVSLPSPEVVEILCESDGTSDVLLCDSLSSVCEFSNDVSHRRADDHTKVH